MESLVTGSALYRPRFFSRNPDQSRPASEWRLQISGKSRTLPTTLEQAKGAATRIMNKLEEIDFKELGANLEATLKGLNRTSEFSRDRVGAAFFGAGHA